MPKVIYVSHDGTKHELEVEAGLSVMEGAVRNNLRGIIAECGGACSCATCHVYVDAAWMGEVESRGDAEDAMLEAVVDLKPESRLSCQIKVTEALDGLVVHLPERQV